MNRRGFMAGILAAGVAPYVSTMAGVLMPVRARIVVPEVMTATEVARRVNEMLYRGLPWMHEPNIEEVMRDMAKGGLFPAYMLKDAR